MKKTNIRILLLALLTITFLGTVNFTSAYGGGGGGISMDYCPNGDYSPGRYDNTCGTKPVVKTGTTLSGTVLSGARILDKILKGEVDTGIILTNNVNTGSANLSGSKYPELRNKAFKYAYELGITKEKNIGDAGLEGVLLRKQMAKLISEFVIRELGKKPDTTRVCEFTDMSEETTDYKFYAKLSCQLGLMGLKPDGSPDTTFMPNRIVTRAQFGTLLSRAMRGKKYNIILGQEFKIPYYKYHLEALKKAGIISNTNPDLIEFRAYVYIMFLKASTVK